MNKLFICIIYRISSYNDQKKYFDFQYYLKCNPDLKNELKRSNCNQNDWLWRHWVTHGQHEERPIDFSIVMIFTIHHFLSLIRDLKDVLLNANPKSIISPISVIHATKIVRIVVNQDLRDHKVNQVQREIMANKVLKEVLVDLEILAHKVSLVLKVQVENRDRKEKQGHKVLLVNQVHKDTQENTGLKEIKVLREIKELADLHSPNV